MLICIMVVFRIQVRRLIGLLVSNCCVTLDSLMFDHFIFSPFLFIVGFVRSKASVFPRVSDDGVMYLSVKGGIFEVLVCGHTKNWVVLCELNQ